MIQQIVDAREAMRLLSQMGSTGVMRVQLGQSYVLTAYTNGEQFFIYQLGDLAQVDVLPGNIIRVQGPEGVSLTRYDSIMLQEVPENDG